jgi:hypothetical protein
MIYKVGCIAQTLLKLILNPVYNYRLIQVLCNRNYLFFEWVGILPLRNIDQRTENKKNHALAVNENKTKQMLNYRIAINFTYEWMNEKTKDCFPVTTEYTPTIIRRKKYQ